MFPPSEDTQLKSTYHMMVIREVTIDALRATVVLCFGDCFITFSSSSGTRFPLGNSQNGLDEEDRRA